MPLVRRTRATLRSAEFGFFVFKTIFLRPWRTSWLIVGIARTGENSPLLLQNQNREHGCERHNRRGVSGLKSSAAYLADRRRWHLKLNDPIWLMREGKPPVDGAVAHQPDRGIQIGREH